MALTIDVYTTRTCPYCIKAKRLLDQKSVSYTEIDVSDDADRRLKMVERANGRKTVPQIFINGHHVGGCDDLYALESTNQLDPLLVT
jgi:glutaredoxin 3